MRRAFKRLGARGLLILLLPFMGCRSPCPPVQALDLVCNEAMLPSGWSLRDRFSAAGDRHVLEDQRARDFAGAGFALCTPPSAEKECQVGHPSAGHVVWDLGNGLWAFLEFRQQVRAVPETLDEEPVGLQYQSPWADRFRVQCSRVPLDPPGCIDCSAVAQYGKYVWAFGASVGTGCMTSSEFDATVAAIDRAVACRLCRD